MRSKPLALAVLAAATLTGSGCGRLRFADRPCVWQVDDKRPIAEPEGRDYLIIQYFADVFAMRRLERTLALPDLEPAHDVNAMEEVPDSTWFENRIGRSVNIDHQVGHGTPADNIRSVVRRRDRDPRTAGSRGRSVLGVREKNSPTPCRCRRPSSSDRSTGGATARWGVLKLRR